MMNGGRVLIDLALSYVAEINSTLTANSFNLIRSAFEHYLNGQISSEDCTKVLLQELENTSPLERINDILAVGDKPMKLDLAQSMERQFGSTRKKTRPWKTEEDNRLIKGVCKYGFENWSTVAQFVGNGRTRSMCSQRWLRVLDPHISKDHWTREEETQLLNLVNLFGTKCWMKVAKKLGNRSDVQCRYKYQQMERSTAIKNSQFENVPIQNPIPQQQHIPGICPPQMQNMMQQPANNSSVTFNPPPPIPPSSFVNQTAPIALTEKFVRHQMPPAQMPQQQQPQENKNIPLSFADGGLTSSFDMFKSNNVFDSSIWL